MSNAVSEEVIVELKGITKGFLAGTERIEILDGVDLSLRKGEKVAIVGPSGSGKTTLLSLIAGFDTPEKGSVTVAGTDLSALDERSIARFRNQSIGVVFQSFELVSPFTALENVMAPLDIAGKRDPGLVTEWIQAVGLESRQHALPATLSGGEKQRVAIARALVMHPAVLLADEPTGSLDRVTGGRIIDLLIAEAEKTGATLVVITHDLGVSEKMDRVFELRDRKLHVVA